MRNHALESRASSVLVSRVRWGSIILAHMLVVMSTVLTIRDHDHLGIGQMLQVATLFMVPPAALGTYAAICPVDFPPGGVMHVVCLIAVWSALCVINAATWWYFYEAPQVERTLRALISLAAAGILGYARAFFFYI